MTRSACTYKSIHLILHYSIATKRPYLHGLASAREQRHLSLLGNARYLSRRLISTGIQIGNRSWLSSRHGRSGCTSSFPCGVCGWISRQRNGDERPRGDEKQGEGHGVPLDASFPQSAGLLSCFTHVPQRNLYIQSSVITCFYSSAATECKHAVINCVDILFTGASN
jgi:hypothetical protein